MWGGEVFISNFQGFGKGSDDAEEHKEQGLAPQMSQNFKATLQTGIQGQLEPWSTRLLSV